MRKLKRQVIVYVPLRETLLKRHLPLVPYPLLPIHDFAIHVHFFATTHPARAIPPPLTSSVRAVQGAIVSMATRMEAHGSAQGTSFWAGQEWIFFHFYI